MGYEWFDTHETEITDLFKDTARVSGLEQLELGLTLEHLEVSDINSEYNEASDTVIGDPEKDAENWHLQDAENSCAVCCQEFVAEQLLGEEFSEEQFSKVAEKNGWYDANTGTTLNDVGKILEACGLDVERTKGATLNDLAEDLREGNKLICAVSASVLDNPEFAKMPGTKADHAVQVIGIDVANPKDIKVILNDPGVSDGKGRIVSADTFMEAWNKGKNYVASVSKEK